MAQKKASSEKKKTTGKKKTGHAQSARPATKAKQVLTKVLEGAATGAIKGAVEAVDTGSKKSKRGKKE